MPIWLFQLGGVLVSLEEIDDVWQVVASDCIEYTVDPRPCD